MKIEDSSIFQGEREYIGTSAGDVRAEHRGGYTWDLYRGRLVHLLRHLSNGSEPPSLEQVAEVLPEREEAS